jgi:pimeloyl-ACP methyl ester carboxylesterase
MKRLIYIAFCLMIAAGAVAAQAAATPLFHAVKVEPKPEKGFAYPYYLYVPEAVRDEAKEGKRKKNVILVIPNNAGKTSDDFNVHESDVKRKIKNNSEIADRLGTALLMPVFPRPETDWRIYTHALDRDALTTDKRDFSRFDLQLIAMIDDARERLSNEKLKFDKQVVMVGFSASGMFTNRFAFLHPKRVKAAVIGSPGGWPIVPASAVDGKPLRYPIGTSDLKQIIGKELDLRNLRKVPMFLFLGDKDDNDSVVFRDSYEQEDEELIFALFGKKPVDRWEDAKKLYVEQRLNAEFRLYRNVQHAVTKEIAADILTFLAKVLAAK